MCVGSLDHLDSRGCDCVGSYNLLSTYKYSVNICFLWQCIS